MVIYLRKHSKTWTDHFHFLGYQLYVLYVTLYFTNIHNKLQNLWCCTDLHRNNETHWKVFIVPKPPQTTYLGIRLGRGWTHLTNQYTPKIYTLIHIKEENSYLGTQTEDPIAGNYLHIPLGSTFQNFNRHKESISKKD